MKGTRVYFVLLFSAKVLALEFLINRELFQENEKTYCAKLRCLQHEEKTMASLINMSIYSISETTKKRMLTTISLTEPNTQNTTSVEKEAKIITRKSKIIFSIANLTECNQGSFLCQLYFVNNLGFVDVDEGFILPTPEADTQLSDLKLSLQMEIPHSDVALFYKKNGKNMKVNHDDISKKQLEAAKEIARETNDRLKEIRDMLRSEMTNSTDNKDPNFLENLRKIEANLTQELASNTKFFQENENENFNSESNGVHPTSESQAATGQRMSNDSIETLNSDNSQDQNVLALLRKLDTKLTQTMNTIIKSFEDKIDRKIMAIQDGNQSVSCSGKDRGEPTAISIINDISYFVKKTKKDHSKISQAVCLAANLNDPKNPQGEITEDMLQCEKSAMLPCLPAYVVLTLQGGRKILCDTKTDGGGWIVLMRRFKFDENFTRTWEDYKNGFGSLDGDHWIGNDLLSNITSKGKYRLRVETYYSSSPSFQHLIDFKVQNETMKYKLTFAEEHSYSMLVYNNKEFATIDRDDENLCATRFKGGWWFNVCTGAVWTSPGIHISARWYRFEMKFRRM